MELPKGPDPDLDPAGYLRSLGAVRERCRVITTKAVKNELRHFDTDMGKFPEVVSFVASIIKVCIYLINTKHFAHSLSFSLTLPFPSTHKRTYTGIRLGENTC